MRFELAFLLMVLCALYVNATSYSATVTGKLVCNLPKHKAFKGSVPAADVSFNYSASVIQLKEKDMIFPDSDISQTNADENGHFKLNGTKSTFPFEDARFYIQIEHRCTNDGTSVCYREYVTDEFDDKNSVTKAFKDIDITNKQIGC
ncbi:hypothetical protein M3Y97_00155900 [Aphelenchoides bicaudatus]|nr:hypothetical protein M3Y97_00155900 [Aphelenchoides bicaudatus]